MWKTIIAKHFSSQKTGNIFYICHKSRQKIVSYSLTLQRNDRFERRLNSPDPDNLKSHYQTQNCDNSTSYPITGDCVILKSIPINTTVDKSHQNQRDCRWARSQNGSQNCSECSLWIITVSFLMTTVPWMSQDLAYSKHRLELRNLKWKTRIEWSALWCKMNMWQLVGRIVERRRKIHFLSQPWIENVIAHRSCPVGHRPILIELRDRMWWIADSSFSFSMDVPWIINYSLLWSLRLNTKGERFLEFFSAAGGWWPLINRLERIGHDFSHSTIIYFVCAGIQTFESSILLDQNGLVVNSYATDTKTCPVESDWISTTIDSFPVLWDLELATNTRTLRGCKHASYLLLTSQCLNRTRGDCHFSQWNGLRVIMSRSNDQTNTLGWEDQQETPNWVRQAFRWIVFQKLDPFGLGVFQPTQKQNQPLSRVDRSPAGWQEDLSPKWKKQ
jgi:hypothetical protein